MAARRATSRASAGSCSPYARACSSIFSGGLPDVKTLVVVQARMGSRRLPGKVLLPLAGRPLLERMLQRLLAARFPFQVCVATSTAAQDEPIRQLCRRLAVPVVSGHPTDLLARHLQAG